MKASAAFQPKNRNQSRPAPVILAVPLLIAIVALACVALASYAPRAQAQSTCNAPTYTGDHEQIWTGALTVGNFDAGGETYYGFRNPGTGALDPTAVTIGMTDHPVTTAVVQDTGTNAGLLSWNFATPGHPTDSEVASLTLYVCDESFPLRGFAEGGNGQYTLANSGLDWSAETPLTLYISSDTTMPTLQSAVVDGATLELTYNEPLYEGGSTGASAFDVTIGTADAVNPSDVSTSGTTVTLTLATAVTSSDTVTLTYTKPGTTTDRVQDLGGNEAVALSSQAVTNATLDEVVLVSNTAQTAGGTSDSIIATSFQTGTNLPGYIVSEVSIRVLSVGSAGTVVTIRENNSSNRPGSLVETLANPASFTANALNVFTAPPGTTLDAGETYWITVNEGLNSNRGSYITTSSNAQTGQTGWTIADGGLSRTNTSNNWSSGNSSLSMEIKGYLVPNMAPTAADGSVGTTTNTPYTFEAGDFNFADGDEGDELEKVKIVTLPDDGTLALDGTDVTLNQEITKSDIDNGDLTFAPATDATGSPYTTFTFKVNDGDDDSASAYTMTVNVSTSSDATLSAITVTGGTVSYFAPGRRSYEVGVASTVSQTTVSATTNHIEASVRITPADADAADGHQVDLSAGQNAVTIVVTADNDSTTETYTVNVNRGVADDYGWKAVDDFDTLIGAGVSAINGIWSDGTTMWVGDQVDDKLYAFTSATKARDSSEDFDTLTGVTNVWDIWSDGATTMWMLDTNDNEINAFNLSTKARESGKDFSTLAAAGNTSPRGIWSDGETMWVTDSTANKIFAYNMDTKARDPGEDFDTLSAAGNDVPLHLWSDGSTMWVVDANDGILYAYRMADKQPVSSRNFNTLASAGNTSLRGIWSDGGTMWVAQNNFDPLSDKIYSYNMPDRPNRAPTAAFSSVSMNANTTYTFVADDFNFADPDSDAEDALEKVKIVTLPNSGGLTLSGAAVSIGQEIARADIDNGHLQYTPPADVTGNPLTSFRFKVNDGEAESVDDYRMNVRVGAFSSIVDPDDRGTYGDPLKAVIAVNSGWNPFTLETRTADEWFATDLERNKRYFIRINTPENSRRPRLSAMYGPGGNQHLGHQHEHGSGQDCSRGPGGRSCAGYGSLQIWIGDESHPAGRYYFHVNAPHGITEQPDEDFPPGENPYQYSIRVDGPTDGSSAPPSPLTAEFSDVPPEHNGSDAFALQLTFDDSIKGGADDVRDSITVTNGALTTVAQNQWDISRWDLTVTPSGAEDITVELAASGPCDEEGALCTLNGRVLETAVRVSVEYVPPPPTITSVSLVTDAGDNDAWDVDELVTAEVVFSAPVNIQGQPTLGISLTGARREAAYASGDTTTTLRFSYRITAAEAGAISAGLISNGFNTETGIIADTRTRLAILDFEANESMPLTGQFQNSPANHGGAGERFTFNIQFSLEPDLNASTIRDDIFTVTNGDIIKVRRTTRQGENRNSRWLIRVEPDGDSDMTLTIPVTTNCSWLGALCNADGTKFSTPISLMVPGPNSPAANSIAAGTPTISGTVQVGETLTADTSGISDADGLTSVAYSYQWLADDLDLTGATSSTYTLAATDQGTAIKVVVSFTDDADNAESLTSAATGAVAAAPTPNSQAEGRPTITGTTTTGSTLTAVTSGITDADGMESAVFSYQWLRGDAAITGATGSTYVLATADEGNTIKVRVSFSDDEGNIETLTSTGSASIASTPTNTPATGQPAITGTTTVGSVLTAGASGIGDANGLENASFTYQWLRSDAEIPDASGSTYTVVLADEGEAIKVRVSFTDDDGFSESRTSAGLDVPVVALEGFFDETTVPDHHNGKNTTFTFELYFSVEPSLGFKDVRDDVLTLTNGSVTRAARTNPQSDDRNSRWTITVQPGGTSAVTIAFSPTTDCTADSAVCTSTGKTLSNSGGITVAGP